VARESVMDLHLRSIMGVPLKHQDEVIGLIYLDNSSEGRIFLQADLYILELLAQEAAIALANARLLGDVHRLREYADHIIASTPVALLVLDRMGRVERHNERGGHLLAAMGAASDDSTPWLDLIRPSDREAWGALLRSVLDSGKSVQELEIHPTLQMDNREIKPWFSISIEPVIVDGCTCLIIAVDDITKRKKAEDIHTSG